MCLVDPPLEPKKSPERLLQELVYAVSHDLGASARTIKSFSELLRRRCADALDADGQKFLKLLSQSASDLQAQLDGLLAYSRVESRGQPLLATDIAEIWNSVKAAASFRIHEVGALVEQGDLPTVFGDAKQLTQLLSELLENAIKFRREVPLRVRLTATRRRASELETQSSWIFRLSDNGRGIATEHLERVFQMFQRCVPDVPGVGAGLAVAQRIVQRHRGAIWADSIVGVETTICFTMPVLKETE